MDSRLAALKATYDSQGYVVVPDLIPPTLLPALCAASDRVTAKTRTGAWPHRRTVGKQFPPFDDDDALDVWGVQHVMHPALGEPVFAQWYTSDGVREAAAALLGCQADALQMELFNLLVNPSKRDFALRWHRDDVRETATAEEERIALAAWSHGVQWNTALYEDACLYLVPGSHTVPRTEAQRAHSTTLAPPQDPLAMPGAIRLVLQPCETVFYNSNVLHCATYDAAQQRATLHATMGDTRGGATRARNVLQHGLTWMRDAAFRETLGTPEGRGMLDALIAMQDGVQGDVGYSLIG